MSDFRYLISEVLSYCGKDSEKASSIILERYSDFSKLAQTDFTVLSEQIGEKYATMIRVVAAIAARRITDNFKFGKAHTEKELLDFLSGYYFDTVNETVIVLPLDSQGRILSAEIVVEGTVNFSGVLPRKLLEIMIKHKSKSAYLAHNHPGGKAVASAEDIETTGIVSELLRSADKELICHYIVANGEITKLTADR